MATLNIQAPDGKTLNIDVPEGTDPSTYDSIVDDVMKDYTSSAAATEDPGVLKSAALGAMSGIPLAQTAVSGIQAMSPDVTYEQAHKKLEEAKDAAWEKHPVAYGGGKTAGLVGTALVAPEGLVGAAAAGAGYGIDTSAKPADMLEDAAIGGAGGAVLHGVGKTVLNPLLEKAGTALGGVAKRGLASLGKETSIEDIQSYLKNPEAIRNALSKTQVADKVAGLTEDIGKASGQLSSEARGVLSSENPLDIKNIKNAAMDAMKKYFPEGTNLTKADETASNAIIEQYQKLASAAEANNGEVPETLLRTMIDRMQAATKESAFGNPEAGASQTALKEFTGHLNDLLRKANPEYAKAMAPSAEAAGLSSNLQKGFGIEDGKATDKTFGKVGNLLKEGKPDEMALAEQLKNMTGTDIVDQLKNAQTKENFGATGPGGALKLLMTGMGFGMGHATGIPGGGIGGAAIGRYAAEGIDGGHIAKSILDMYMKGTDNAALKTYGPILIQAAKQGGNSLAATHFVLATSHPEYQKLVEEAQGNPQE